MCSTENTLVVERYNENREKGMPHKEQLQESQTH